ncbi:MAG: alpha/beta fold hydrolase, partial [Deltaproteobacteria bacterium]|nr:alpha/beta fold hydrolase [Deltaproteobacteria bacterium]
MNSNSKLFNLPMIVALVLILGGGWLAFLVQTGGGDIDVRDVRFMGANGTMMSALLYVPEGVTAKNKAPGIVAIHGYINSRETQDGFAIEYARRGYVVLALDQTGHGYSDPPAFGNGYGGIDGLKYIRSLDIVDVDNIGLEGHSMGGWASAIAAAVVSDGYKSFVMASSSTGTFGAPDGTPTYPRNMALIFSEYDEFSGLMWGAPVPKDIIKTDKLKKLFNTTETVEVGKLYGSIEDGTARKLYSPSMIHPKVHFSTEGIGNAIEWMQATLKGGNGLPPSDQTWYWKEFFTFLALIGMVVLIFPLGGYLLQTDYFKELQEEPASQKSLSGWGWWVSAVITILLPVPMYIWAWTFHSKGIAAASFFWPQWVTTTIMFWALGVAVVSLVLFLLWHALSNKKKGANLSDYGVTWKNEGLKWGRIGKSFFLALIVVFVAHLSLAFSDWAFQTDYRLWVMAIKPLDALHFGMIFGYIIPFAFYFLVLGTVLHGQMRPGKDGFPHGIGKETVINILLLVAGYFLFLAFHYGPLFGGGTLGIPDLNLAGIVMFQFIPIFTIVGLVTTYFYRKTGHIYVGAFICAMLVTWTVVAG